MVEKDHDVSVVKIQWCLDYNLMYLKIDKLFKCE